MRKHRRQLGAGSFGAPGPHDFAVRLRAARQSGTSASTASPPHVRDDRETPLCNEAGWRQLTPNPKFGKQEYFSVAALTGRANQMHREQKIGGDFASVTSRHGT